MEGSPPPSGVSHRSRPLCHGQPAENGTRGTCVVGIKHHLGIDHETGSAEESVRNLNAATVDLHVNRMAAVALTSSAVSPRPRGRPSEEGRPVAKRAGTRPVPPTDLHQEHGGARTSRPARSTDTSVSGRPITESTENGTPEWSPRAISIMAGDKSMLEISTP
jgi:hypothetical protein